ncbi:Gfo/Idh/MocA family protein [Embleya sp. AB8]|uniref:Gfo/Idh/MocA family protein n=1 Tax=Embleya sp. AB8 TaxID=3156304 RepID=UPI003C713DDA
MAEHTEHTEQTEQTERTKPAEHTKPTEHSEQTEQTERTEYSERTDQTTQRAPVAVGLVGAGPWATRVHAPVFAAGPETRLTAVWARRPEAARALAEPYGAVACVEYDELLDRCEAVVFAVAPEAQPALAERAARAGKAVLLEKPIAADPDTARRLAEVIGAAGVGSMVALSARYAPRVREFLAHAENAETPWRGGRLSCVSGAFLDGPFAASPWRQTRGAILDIGPHAFDLMSVALGDVVDVRADSPGAGWTALQLVHAGGAVSQVVLCGTATGGHRYDVELYGSTGALALDLTEAIDAAAFAVLRAEFAALVRDGGEHVCDVRRGLYLQEVIARAERQLAAAR